MPIKKSLLNGFGKVVAISRLLGFLLSGCSLSPHTADTQLVDDITARIEREATFSKKLRVSAEHGKVVVSGLVSSTSQAEYLTHILSEIQGIKSIENNVVVDPLEAAHHQIRDSERIALYITSKNPQLSVSQNLLHNIRDTIEQETDSGKYNILIESSEGKILLSGEVENGGTAQKILDVAKNVAKNVEVQSLMSIKKVPDNVIRNQVISLLSEFPPVAVKGLSFTVDEGVVSYFGEVDNHEHIDAVLSQTLMINGVNATHSSVSYPKK